MFHRWASAELLVLRAPLVLREVETHEPREAHQFPLLQQAIAITVQHPRDGQLRWSICRLEYLYKYIELYKYYMYKYLCIQVLIHLFVYVFIHSVICLLLLVWWDTMYVYKVGMHDYSNQHNDNDDKYVMILIKTLRCSSHPLLNWPQNRPIPYSPFLDCDHVMFYIDIHVQMSRVRYPL